MAAEEVSGWVSGRPKPIMTNGDWRQEWDSQENSCLHSGRSLCVQPHLNTLPLTQNLIEPSQVLFTSAHHGFPNSHFPSDTAVRTTSLSVLSRPVSAFNSTDNIINNPLSKDIKLSTQSTNKSLPLPTRLPPIPTSRRSPEPNLNQKATYSRHPSIPCTLDRNALSVIQQFTDLPQIFTENNLVTKAAMSCIEDIDWDQFLVDADLGDKAIVSSASSAISSSVSTEFSQSVALDPAFSQDPTESQISLGFGFAGFCASPTGITHRLENMSCQTDQINNSPDIMQGELSCGLFAGFDISPTFQSFISTPVSTSVSEDNAELVAAISSLVSASSVEPTQLTLSPSSSIIETPPLVAAQLKDSLKRKASDSCGDDAAPAPKRRGRPPGTGKPKSLVTKPQPPSFKTTPSPISSTTSLFSEDGSPAVRCTITGKPSTDRPKSVVPAKFLKDGTAQSILGMSIPQINSYPTFSALLADVHPSFLPAAREFGEKISDNRDKAKDAAKKSRDERRVKIERAEYLEKRCEELESKVERMMGLLVGLVEKGLIGKSDVVGLAA
nr:hypothetical protein L204_03353 [Cryptococcus depauperatus CBS 7855]